MPSTSTASGLSRRPPIPTIAAAGNIVCDTADPAFADGAGTADACHMASTSTLVLRPPTGVLVLGDAQDDDGSLYNFQHAYARSWGRLLPMTHPVFPAARTTASPARRATSATSAPPRAIRLKGYYSFDIGSWHIVALNAVCAPVGGCEAGSAQEQWLRADLAGPPGDLHPRLLVPAALLLRQDGQPPRVRRVLARPLSRGRRCRAELGRSGLRALRTTDPKAVADPASGIREFVVGTGGIALKPFGAPSRTARRGPTPRSASSS